MMVMIRYECKRGRVWGWGEPAGRGGGKKRVMGTEYNYIVCMYENSTLKPTKTCTKVRVEGMRTRKSNRGGEFDQSTLYACAEISQ
jgi:hypothetical protein